jgi:fructokinase
MPNPKILVTGELLVDFLPRRGDSIAESESFDRRSGGAPANVAVGLTQLGRVPWFWTRVGRDPFGDFLVETLSEYGVPRRFVERDPTAKTPLAFVDRGADSDRNFSFYRDGTADTRLDRDGVPEETLQAVDLVYVGSVMLASGTAKTATVDLVSRANEHDCTVVFDVNARPELWDDGEFARVVGGLLGDVDVVKATPADLQYLPFVDADDSPETLARRLCDRGPAATFLTLGESGSYVLATHDAPLGSGTATHEGYEVAAVDTTGAGDAFTAGVLAALVEGERDLQALLAFANAVAAVSTTARGAMTTLPTRDRVRQFRVERDSRVRD